MVKNKISHVKAVGVVSHLHVMWTCLLDCKILLVVVVSLLIPAWHCDLGFNITILLYPLLLWWNNKIWFYKSSEALHIYGRHARMQQDLSVNSVYDAWLWCDQNTGKGHSHTKFYIYTWKACLHADMCSYVTVYVKKIL